MVIDFANNLIEGFHTKDSIKVRINPEKPSFSDGDNTFTYRRIKYNFKSKKDWWTMLSLSKVNLIS